MRAFVVCPECFEPHPAGRPCPACTGHGAAPRAREPVAAPAPPAAAPASGRRKVAGVVALGVLGLGFTMFCLLALRYLVAI